MNPIKAYRLKYKISAREIAEKIKCDISYIYHIESGRARPSYRYAKAISLATNGEISAIELLEARAA
jgi:transcriptional regulator with XRE-family HTH domain